MFRFFVSAVPRAACALILLLCVTAVGSAQDVIWARSHGGAGWDGAYDVTETSDGGFIVTGFTSSEPGGVERLYLLRTDSEGNEIWSRSFSGPYNVWGSEVLEHPAGGFIVAGCYEVNPYTFDSYVIRLNANGVILWQYRYDAGIGDDDRAHAICLTPDGGFVIAGQAWQPEPPFGSYDVYLVKCDANGAPEWRRFHKWAPEGADVALSIARRADGGFMIGGFTQAGIWAAYVIRTDALGIAMWERTYGDAAQGEANDLWLTPDGGCVITGAFLYDWSTDTDFSLLKIAENGDLEWEHPYTESGQDYGQQVKGTVDGGYLIAGYTTSFGEGQFDGRVLRTDASGEVLWSYNFGSPSDDRAWAIEQTLDGNTIVAGWEFMDTNNMELRLIKLRDSSVAGTPAAAGDVAEGGLLRIAPNPFHGATRFDFEIPSSGSAALRIYDAGGREVRTLFRGERASGRSTVAWDGRDERGQPLPAGTYFGSLDVDGRTVTRKLVLLPAAGK